jgi:hypothetical protein
VKLLPVLLLLCGCAFLDPANQWKPVPPKSCDVVFKDQWGRESCKTGEEFEDWKRRNWPQMPQGGQPR